MPVDFLTQEKKDQYGRFSRQISSSELARTFHFDDFDLSIIKKRRGLYNRLGFALQLGTVRFIGTFLPNPLNVPQEVIDFTSKQLDISDTSSLINYMGREATRLSHTSEIRMIYGYRDFSNPSSRFRLIRWLYARSWLTNERPTYLFDLATHWLMDRKVLLPGATTLARLISQIRDRTSLRTWQSLSGLPNKEQRGHLEKLLSIQDGNRRSQFDSLRQSPRRVSSLSIKESLERYKTLKNLGIRELDFSSIPPIRLKALARYATTGWAPTISRMPKDRRIATLVAFAYTYEVESLDDVIDLFDLLITDIASSAKMLGLKRRLRTLQDLDKAALELADICGILLDEKCPDRDVRKAIFSKHSKDHIAQTILTVEDLAQGPGEDYQSEMLSRYKTVRRFFPHILENINFQAAPAGQSVIEAITYLKTLDELGSSSQKDPPIDMIDSGWRRLVINKDGSINKSAYTLCVLERLQDRLRRRDIYIVESERWGDPRSKLLQGAEWKSKRSAVCRSLGHPSSATQVVEKLEKELDDTYQRVAKRFSENEKVYIEKKNGKPTLTITNLEKLDEPLSLINLREAVTSLMPRVDLAEILLEIQSRTGFASEFTHVSEENARVGDLPTSICAVLLGEACNIGLQAISHRETPALMRGRLHWVQQNYIRAETLSRANARLVDYQSSLSLAQKIGGGEVSSADGLRFVTPIRTLNSGPNRKYFGSERGITYYNFTSDQYTGFHSIVVPGTLRDSIYILEGLLEQQTNLKPTEIMADTAGVSDLVFGLFWLLGYQFSPRMADAGEARFYRINVEADYGTLNEIARHRVNPQRILQHWDDMLRIAGSLKLGTVQASELVRSLLKSDRPSSLTRAIMELGRINKTIYLLNYVDDPLYRRRILTQLNRGEGRHQLIRSICYGKRGEIRKPYREGQEDQLNALNLVTNAVVLWNTIYMEAAISYLREKGLLICQEDLKRLSPLMYKHINLLGRYSFDLEEPIANGNLRPLYLDD